MKPPFFILGCPRSGTTLLRNLLRSHPRLTVPPESHFVPAFYLAYGDPGDERAARRMAARILTLHWVRRWNLDATPADFSDCRSYAELVARLYGAYAVREGASRWGDKTPQYARSISILARIFPKARFVHVVRDGRDAALSLMRTFFGPRNVHAAARYWRAHVAAARAGGAALGPERYHELRYEDLLADPAQVLRRLCAFLDEPFDPAVLSPSPIDWRAFPPVFGPRGGGHVSDFEIVRDNTAKWRTAMSAADRRAFESAAGGLLAELGYEIGASGIGPGRLQRLGWRVEDWTRRAAYQAMRGNRRLWVPTEMRLLEARLRGRARARLGRVSSGTAS